MNTPTSVAVSLFSKYALYLFLGSFCLFYLLVKAGHTQEMETYTETVDSYSKARAFSDYLGTHSGPVHVDLYVNEGYWNTNECLFVLKMKSADETGPSLLDYGDAEAYCVSDCRGGYNSDALVDNGLLSLSDEDGVLHVTGTFIPIGYLDFQMGQYFIELALEEQAYRSLEGTRWECH